MSRTNPNEVIALMRELAEELRSRIDWNRDVKAADLVRRAEASTEAPMDDCECGYGCPPGCGCRHSGESQASPDGGETEVSYEVWIGDECAAMATSPQEASRYAAQYSQESSDKVEVFTVYSRKVSWDDGGAEAQQAAPQAEAPVPVGMMGGRPIFGSMPATYATVTAEGATKEITMQEHDATQDAGQGEAIHGFPREDLEAIADGLDGYERTVNVGNTTGEGDEHIESMTAAAARFIRASLESAEQAEAIRRAWEGGQSLGRALASQPAEQVGEEQLEAAIREFGKHCVTYPATWTALRAVLALASPAPQQPVSADTARLNYLQEHGATVDLPMVGGVLKFRIGGLHRAVHQDIRVAIDAALSPQQAEQGRSE